MASDPNPLIPTAAPSSYTPAVLAGDEGTAEKDRLFNRGYLSLLAAQFFGAANDNILKQCLTFMVATGIWSGSLADGGLGEGGQVVPALLLTLPFIFLSGYAGQITDRLSKRTVMLGVKIAEIPIALIALIGFITQNLWVTLFALLLLSIQSSFFGPAKYGVIPELVADRHLSMANGLINMLTNLAVISGSLAAGPLSDLFDPTKAAAGTEPILWAPGMALLAVAIAGLASIVLLPALKPAKPDLKFNFNPFATYVESLRDMAKTSLLGVTFAWSGFYMVAMIALMIIPEYSEILGISYEETSYFLGILGVAIAIGSVAAGLISRKHIQPSLIPVGAVGMTTFFFLLGIMTPTFNNVAALIFGAGIFAGFYIVPLQALLQHLSPDDERGRFLGTANALAFCFSSLGAILYWIATNRTGMSPYRVHLICGALALVGTILGIVRLRRVGIDTTRPGKANAGR